jgi:hypothetical protein
METTPHLSTPRTGPVGRAARIMLLAVFAILFGSLVDEDGAVGLRSSTPGDEPGLLVVTVVMGVLFVGLAGELGRVLVNDLAARRWRLLASTGLLAATAVSAAVGWLMSGTIWEFPLVDAIWWFDVVMFGQTIVALLVAIVLGTPGCEVRVWPELIYRLRGHPASNPPRLVCVIGLDFIDAWEARPARGTDAGSPSAPDREGRTGS